MVFIGWPFFCFPQAIEDEGGNPEEIEITSEGNKKMPKRPGKGKESLSHCVNAIGSLCMQSLLSPLSHRIRAYSGDGFGCGLLFLPQPPS